MARVFSGSTQWMEKTSAVITTVPLTICCWVLWITAATDRRCIGIGCKSPANTDLFSAIIQTATKKMTALSTNGAAGSDSTAASSTVLTVSTWYHAAFVYATTSSRSCYINGGGKVTSTVSIIPTAGHFNDTGIGGYYNNGAIANTFNGNIAFPAFWNAALSDSDVLSLSKGASPKLIRPDALVSYTRMTGSSSPEPDYSQSSTWAINGAPTEVANPLIYYP
jgi:hypothetical protein